MAMKTQSPPNVVTRAALYLRVSTGRQADSDLSIPDQQRQLHGYCQAKGWEVKGVFFEPGTSATDDRRPAFQTMIDAAVRKPPDFDVILVHSFSRFFRDQFQFEFYARKLARNGVRIVSITQELGDDPMSLMMRQIMNLFDEYQSKENGKHTLRAMKENARQGFWNGSLPPIGYRTVAVEQRGTKVKKKLQIDPKQAEIVKLIFRLALTGPDFNGPLGVKRIAAHLNDAGITTRSGGPWSTSSVYEVLRRTSYFGEHRFNTRVFASGERKDEDEHVIMSIPAIVSRREFDAVQRSLARRAPTTPRARSMTGSMLLGGISFCGLCAGAMTLRTGKSGRYRYYVCCTRARTGPSGCEGIAVPAERLDQAITEYLESRLLEPSELVQMMSDIITKDELWATHQRRRIADLEARSVQIGTKIQRIYVAIEEGLIDAGDQSLKARLTILRRDREEVERLTQHMTSMLDMPAAALTADGLRDFALYTRAKMRDGDAYRRDLTKAVAQRIDVLSTDMARLWGCRIELLRVLATSNGVQSAAFDLPAFSRTGLPGAADMDRYSRDIAL